MCCFKVILFVWIIPYLVSLIFIWIFNKHSFFLKESMEEVRENSIFKKSDEEVLIEAKKEMKDFSEFVISVGFAPLIGGFIAIFCAAGTLFIYLIHRHIKRFASFVFKRMTGDK